MNKLVFVCIALLALAACGQNAPAVTKAKPNYPAQGFAASSDTQARTAVKQWSFQGAETGFSISGTDVGGKTQQTLSVAGVDANTFKVVRRYQNAAGETLASLELLLKNDGKYTSSKTGNPFDVLLCPECMGNDLTSANPDLNPAALRPQLAAPPVQTAPPVMIADPTDVSLVTTACSKAQRHLAQAAMAVSQFCNGASSNLNCAIALAGYWFIYSQEVVPTCGPLIGGGPGL